MSIVASTGLGIAVSKPFILGCALSVLTAAAVFQLSSGDPTTATTQAGAGTETAGPALTDSSPPFTIEGHATEAISPGIQAPIDVKLTNPYDTPLSVTDLRVSVQTVTAPHADHAHPCAIADFSVRQGPTGLKVTIPASTTNTLNSLGITRASWPAVGMLNRPANQDGCKGASLTLAYTASGTAEQ